MLIKVAVSEEFVTRGRHCGHFYGVAYSDICSGDGWEAILMPIRSTLEKNNDAHLLYIAGQFQQQSVDSRTARDLRAFCRDSAQAHWPLTLAEVSSRVRGR